MKQKFALTDADLTVLQTPGLPAESANKIWQDVCKRVGCQFTTLEDAKTGDPREFLAEPVAPEPPGDEVLMVATSADNALEDSLCAGRNLAQRGIPDHPATADSLTEQRILRALADSGNMANMKPPLSASEREMFDKCRQIEKAIAGPFFGEGPFKSGEYRVFRQERLWLPNSGKPGFFAHWGEPHAVFRVGTKALVVQYKVLAGDVVDVSANRLLRDWTVLADLAVLVAGHYAPLDMVAVVIIEPLVTTSPEIVSYTLFDLEEAYKHMVARITVSNNPQSPRTPGEVQCKSCKAVGRCVENAAWMTAQKQAVLENAIQPGQTKPVQETPVLEPPVYLPKKSLLARASK